MSYRRALPVWSLLAERFRHELRPESNTASKRSFSSSLPWFMVIAVASCAIRA